MPGCVVPRCGKNSSQNNYDERLDKRVSFHNLPSEPEMREKWVEAIRYGGRPEHWEPTPNAKICCLHFDISDLIVSGNMTKIKRTAVPRIPYSPYKKCRKSRQGADALTTLVQGILTPEDMTSSSQEDFNYSVQVQEILGANNMEVELPQQMPVVSTKTSKKVVVLPPQDHTFEEKIENIQEESQLTKLHERVQSAIKEMRMVAGQGKYNAEVQTKIDQLSSQADELMETIKVSEIMKSLDAPIPDYVDCQAKVANTITGEDWFLLESIISNEVSMDMPNGFMYADNPSFDHLTAFEEPTSYMVL